MSYDPCALESRQSDHAFKSRTVVVKRPTLDPYVDVILRLLSLASVFVGFGEGVCTSSQHMLTTIAPFLSPVRMTGEIFVMERRRCANVVSELNIVEHRMWSRWQGRLRGRLPKVLRFWIVVIKASVR